MIGKSSDFYEKYILNRSKKPWKKDMNLIGILLSKLVTRNCSFLLDDDDKNSALSKPVL